MVSRNMAWERQSDQNISDIQVQAAMDDVQRQAVEHMAGINAYGPQGLDSFMAQQQAAQEAAAKAKAVQQQDATAEEQPTEINDAAREQMANEQLGEDGLTPTTRALLQNPQTREFLEQTQAQSAAVQQAYTQAAAQAVQAASLSLMADVPELNGLSNEQISGALAMMQQNQPERYAQVIGRLQNIHGMSQQLQAHVAQQQQQAFQAKAIEVQNQDQQFEQYAAQVKIPAAERKAIAAEAQQMLLDYGTPESELLELWNNSILRGYAGQRIMADAARYRLAKRGATQRAKPSVPPVQKPGQGFEQVNTNTRAVREAEERFNKIGSAKDAAAWFSPRKAARKSGRRSAV
jgi:hypothetical protein